MHITRPVFRPISPANRACISARAVGRGVALAVGWGMVVCMLLPMAVCAQQALPPTPPAQATPSAPAAPTAQATTTHREARLNQVPESPPEQTQALSTELGASKPAAPGGAPTPTFTSHEAEGDALTLHGHYLAAIRAYQAAQPQTAAVLNKAGVASEHMFMYAQARASYEEALRLKPDSSEAWNNLGTVFHAQTDYRHAEKCYKKAIKLKPKSADALQNLGTLYYARHDYKKGDIAYRQAIAVDPEVMERSARNGIQSAGTARNRAEMHYHLACTYADAGQRALAIEYLRKSILEGFHDRDRMLHEKHFADLRTSELFLKMADDLRKN